MVRQHEQGKLNLRTDVLKFPHHGSADFSPAFLEAVGAPLSRELERRHIGAVGVHRPSRNAGWLARPPPPIRRDGIRLLITTNSGMDNLKQAYAHEFEDHGMPQPAQVG